MRIALDGRVLGHHFPGIGRQVYGLAHDLAALQSDHELLLLVDEDGLRDRWGTRQIGNLTSIPCPSKSLRLPRPPRRQARESNLDLFHATHIAAAADLACATVVTVYDLIPLHFSSALPTFVHRWVYRWMLRRALRSSVRVLTLTEAVKKDLVDRVRVDPDKVVVTSAAVGPDFALPAPAETLRVRRHYGLSDRYVLYVATAREHKNHAGLLAAWPRLGPQRESVDLVFAGSGGKSRSVVERGAKDDLGVVDLGQVPEGDLWPLYGGAEVYMHPSFCEGFGLPVLEAMACGTPVCCSEIPALAEITGEAASRFDPEDSAAMAASLAELLSEASMRERLSHLGRERAARFCGSSVAERTLAAYEEALSDRGSSSR